MNHASNVVTCHLHSGILIFVQNAPIIWFLKQQSTFEGATFGSKLVAQRTCKDMVVALQYKLTMFGVKIFNGPANIFRDNCGIVVENLSVPELTLMKRHNAINYHVVCKAVAAGILHDGKEDSDTNLADVLTKVIKGERQWNLCWFLMW